MQLPPHEPVFVSSVHKSQGSELDQVAFVLPTRSSPVLSRQLVYTALTRARSAISLHGAPQILAEAVARSLDREGGLADRLLMEERPDSDPMD